MAAPRQSKSPDPLSFRIGSEYKNRLTELAAEEGVSVSRLVCRMVMETLDGDRELIEVKNKLDELYDEVQALRRGVATGFEAVLLNTVRDPSGAQVPAEEIKAWVDSKLR